MAKLNCWQVKKCGMEIGGEKARLSAACPASVAFQLTNAHGGIAAGRACWVIENTYCNGKFQGTYGEKIGMCQKCEFFYQIRKEEGEKYVQVKNLLIKRDEQKK